ncbi:MAG: hypothetical protein GWO86_01790 [Planctomycetes bacterium]|nr:hypothetical protein [Planctomycetota bacterium]
MKIEYKANFQQVLHRYQQLWDGRMADGILARIQVRDGRVQRDAFMANVPDIPEMFDDYLDYWRTTAKLEDDTLPVIAPSFGTGIEGGYFGADVKFGDGTSWCEHIGDLMEHPEKAVYNPDSDPVNLVRKCTKYYIDNNQDRCAVAPPNIDCPVDILYMLRGSGIYMDFIDNPDVVKQLLNSIADGVKQFRDEMWGMIPLYEGGTFNAWMNWWVPQRTALAGADLFCTCSLDTYREFGFGVHQQMAKSCGRAWFHLHNLGLHLVPAIAEMENLLCLELSEDPNVEIKGLDLLNRVKSQVPQELVIKVAVRPKEFVDALEAGILPGNTIYDVCEENYLDIDYWDIDYANSLMDKVRKYRN